MKKDAFWPLHRASRIAVTNGTGTNKCDEEKWQLVMCYVDDVVIATPTLEDHIERLDEVFACMKRAGLKCKPSKCEILKYSIKYLGRMVNKHGIRPDSDSVESCQS